MTEQKKREEFLAGSRDRLRLGGYGGTVTVSLEGRRLVLHVNKGQKVRKKKTIGVDEGAKRALAVLVAEQLLERMRGTRRRRTVGPAPARSRPDLLTPRDIWQAYLESLLGSLPGDVLDWTRKDAEAFLRRLLPATRATNPSCDYICSVVQAARTLHQDDAVPLDCDFDILQRGHLTKWARERTKRGASPHTVVTYLRRFRTAIETFADDWEDRWQNRRNPMRKKLKITTRHVKPPEIDDEQAAMLLRTLLEMGEWQAYATAAIAHASGRRVGSISGARAGLHLDAPPLRAGDFQTDPEDLLELTWRADAQKGRAYDRGDVVQIATEQLARVYRWLIEKHPNPLGQQHPLIWDEEDPRRAARYDRLRRVLGEAWKIAFQEEKPAGLSFHGFCRGTITSLADECGIEAAADHSGRSVETAARLYKRTRSARAKQIARDLGRIRANEPDPAAYGNGAAKAPADAAA